MCSEPTERLSVSYDVVDVYNGKRLRAAVFVDGLSGTGNHGRGQRFADGFRSVSEAHTGRRVRRPLAAIRRHRRRARKRRKKRIFDIDRLEGERFFLRLSLERRAHFPLTAERAVLPLPSPPPPPLLRLVHFRGTSTRRGCRARRQHAGRSEIVGTREHHAPADRVH